MAPLVDLSYGGNTERPVVAQWQDIGNPRRHDARDRPGSMQHLIDKGVLLRGIREPKTRVNPQGGRPFRLKSQIDIQNPQKTADQ